MSRIRQFGWDISLVIIAIILVVVLWYLGFKEISILTLIIGFAIWIIQKRIDQQSQIILQASQAGFDFKQQVTKEMYEAAKDLWVETGWLTDNLMEIWSFADVDEMRREKYLDRLKKFDQIRLESSIILPVSIIDPAMQIYSAIETYIQGSEIYTASKEAHDEGSRVKGSEMMVEGRDNLLEVYNGLPQAIRKEFGLEMLPAAIIQPELQPPAIDKS